MSTQRRVAELNDCLTSVQTPELDRNDRDILLQGLLGFADPPGRGDRKRHRIAQSVASGYSATEKSDKVAPMTLTNPTPEEAGHAMAKAIDVERLRRELESVFRDNADTVSELDDEALTNVVLGALRSAR